MLEPLTPGAGTDREAFRRVASTASIAGPLRLRVLRDRIRAPQRQLGGGPLSGAVAAALS